MRISKDRADRAWIFPADPKKYHLFEAFDNLPVIHWIERNWVQVGDVVYFYCVKPYQKILFQAKIVETGVPYADTEADWAYWNPRAHVPYRGHPYSRLELVRSMDGAALSLPYLLRNGLKAPPQNNQRVPLRLQRYLDEVLAGSGEAAPPRPRGGTLEKVPLRVRIGSGREAGPRVGQNMDYQRKEAAARERGEQGERLVLAYEKARLDRAGRPDLVEKLEYTAREVGDGTGYDIRSCREDGTPLYIEVKTTASNRQDGFFLTYTEWAFAEKHPESFRLYRVYNADSPCPCFVEYDFAMLASLFERKATAYYMTFGEG